MVRPRNILSILVAVSALAVTWSRWSIASRKRTVQQKEWIQSSLNKSDGFVFEILERADHSQQLPISAMYQTMFPHASGAYKGRSGSPPLHIHLFDDEEFTIVEGIMGYVIEGKESRLQVGETALLPAGTPHTFWNEDPDRVLKQKVRLINKSGKHSASERFFEQWAANAYDHGGLDNVNPIQLLLTLQAGNIELAMSPPARFLLQNVALPIAKLFGFRGFYPEYVLP